MSGSTSTTQQKLAAETQSPAPLVRAILMGPLYSRQYEYFNWFSTLSIDVPSNSYEFDWTSSRDDSGIFQTSFKSDLGLETTFKSMFLGELFGPLFFILLVIASLSSSISLLEPSVAYFSEEKIISRKKAAFLLGSISWFLGIGSALSFNYLQEFYLLPNMNILDSIVFIGNNLLLPLGGLFVALFLGWFADKKLITEQLELSPPAQGMWLFFIRFVAPLAVFSILISQFLSWKKNLFVIPLIPKILFLKKSKTLLSIKILFLFVLIRILKNNSMKQTMSAFLNFIFLKKNLNLSR